MDRRTWFQLIGILAAARPAFSQPPATATPQPPAGGGRGRGQQQPMRITKDQLKGALVLLALEFQDAELDMMLRGVNSALFSYESLRKVEIPYDTEPAFSFRPGLPDRRPLTGPKRFETTILKSSAQAPPRIWRKSRIGPSPGWRRCSARARSRPPISPGCTSGG